MANTEVAAYCENLLPCGRIKNGCGVKMGSPQTRPNKVLIRLVPQLMAKKLFGTDGIRGIPGQYPLTDTILDRVGFALGHFIQGEPLASSQNSARVLIGRDTRESGPHIAERIARGLAATGVNAVSADVIPTPGVAWLVNREAFAAGVVISASHNPYHDNGVKLISSSGMKFPDAVEAELEKIILAEIGAPVAAQNI